ncbi:hypothetical protein LTR17_005147 [Elasticomyces elasticus]|nr:hypothetical protein LTR17_005147 [Elasticomyces elasticus]
MAPMSDRDQHPLDNDQGLDGPPHRPSAINETAPSFPPPAYLNRGASANDEPLPVYEQSPLFPAYNSGEKQYPQASEGDVEAQRSTAEAALAHDAAQQAAVASNVEDLVERRIRRRVNCCCWCTCSLFFGGMFICIAVFASHTGRL